MNKDTDKFKLFTSFKNFIMQHSLVNTHNGSIYMEQLASSRFKISLIKDNCVKEIWIFEGSTCLKQRENVSIDYSKEWNAYNSNTLIVEENEMNNTSNV